jgi:hypothetical protein
MLIQTMSIMSDTMALGRGELVGEKGYIQHKEAFNISLQLLF